MLKPATSLLLADPRSDGMAIDDLRNMVEPFELSEAVPLKIREQFDIARNAFAHSWFVYEFTMLAELQCYCVLEMALRHRLDPDAPPNTTRSPGLHQLLKTATVRGLLSRQEFEVPSPSGDGGMWCRLNEIPLGRNNLAHGNINLFPQYALSIVELSADVLNRLFTGTPAR
jgi:hypothetical protein